RRCRSSPSCSAKRTRGNSNSLPTPPPAGSSTGGRTWCRRSGKPEATTSVRRVSGQNSTTDIAAGIGAALAFLAMLFLLHMPLWLGVVLAACVYAGVWLVGRGAARAPVEPTETELLQQ